MEVHDYSKGNLFNTWHLFSPQALKPGAQKHANAANESRADLFNKLCFEYIYSMREMQCNPDVHLWSLPSVFYITVIRWGSAVWPSLTYYILVMSELQHILRLLPRQAEVLVLVPAAILIKFPGNVSRPGSDLCFCRQASNAELCHLSCVKRISNCCHWSVCQDVKIMIYHQVS